MDLMDESGEIRATAFKEQCDKFYDMIEIDKVYYISKCTLKSANKQYSNLKNDYEMTFNNDTTVCECMEEDTGIPAVQYDITSISEIANKDPGEIIDVIGVCKDASDVTTLTARTTGRELRKREITLVDSSNASISITLWGETADNFDGGTQPIILVKGGKINEFGGGKSVGLNNSSVMKINPDIPEAHKLRGWFDNGGASQDVTSISARSATGGAGFSTEWMSFREAKMKQLGGGDKPDYFQCKATIHLVRANNALYKACPQPDCNKKVIDQQNGQYRCEKCNQEFSTFKHRLLLNMNTGDWSGSKWVNCFNEVGELLLGKSSQEIGELCDENAEAGQLLFANLAFKSFVLKLRNKMEFYGDSSRIRSSIVTASPINHKEYNSVLIKSLQEMTGVGRG